MSVATKSKTTRKATATKVTGAAPALKTIGGNDAASLKARRRLATDVATMMKHAGDTTRVMILAILADGEQCVSEICRLTGTVSQPAISHHLALLRHGGIIRSRRGGKNNFYAITEKAEPIVQTLRAAMAAL